jgi:superfamily II DNA/RNA helicase
LILLLLFFFFTWWLPLQVGLPADREQYIHRLGRTGRKGKEGQGILLLAPWEEFFLSTTKDLPITEAPPPSVDPDTKKKVSFVLFSPPSDSLLGVSLLVNFLKHTKVI